MKKLTTLLGGVAFAALVCAIDGPAHAYNSKCTIFTDGTVAVPSSKVTAKSREELSKLPSSQYFDVEGDAGEYGPLATHGRLVEFGGQDEHAAIFRQAGIPASILEPLRLRVFTGKALAGSEKFPWLPSYRPVAFADAKHVHTRVFAADELAMLPDFSYAVWDWMDGNESCPLPGYADDGAIRCHSFKEHMGAANANHFPPYADKTYERLHGLAVGRAKECATLGATLGGARDRFLGYVLDCEKEAMAIEATAQHFLQDAWSAGHGWERWGSVDIAQFPDHPDWFEPAWYDSGSVGADLRKLHTAQIVGLSAGWVHGSEPVAGFADAMCSPFPDIQMKSSEGLLSAVGDMHFGKDLTVPEYAQQQVQMLGCVSASAREVYAAFGSSPAHGPMTSSGSPKPTSCLGMRVTNKAITHGVGQDLGGIHHKPADVLFLYDIVPLVLNKAIELNPLTTVGDNNYNNDWLRLGFVAAMRAIEDPEGTDVATMVVPIDPGDGSKVELTMLGTRPNSAYLDPKRAAPFQDPDLPWPATKDTITPFATTRAEKLALAFHRGHVQDWCNQLTAEGLDAIVAHAKTAASSEEKAAACEVCTEILSRHVRSGFNATDYDTSAEPVCTLLTGGKAPVVYQRANAKSESATALASRYCGCGNTSYAAAVTDAGLYSLDLAAGTVVGSPIPLASVPRNAARTGDGRMLITHNDGNLVIVDLGAGREVDTDDDATTTSTGAPSGVTRLLTGGSELLGVQTARGPLGNILGFVTSPQTDQLIVLDLGWPDMCVPDWKYSVIKRIDIGVSATSTELPADIVVLPAKNKIYVSFKAGGYGVSVIDFAKAIDKSAPAGGEVVKRIPVPDFGKASVEALSLSPDGARIAATYRFPAGTCPDPSIGCDKVRLIDTATDTFVTFPTGFNYFSTKPTYFPKGLAWLSDGRLAIGSYSGPDTYPTEAPLGFAGAVMLADPKTGGTTYNAAINGTILGDAVASNGASILVGSSSGNITVLPTTDAFWSSSPATVSGPRYYGGCLADCGFSSCPAKCPAHATLKVPAQIRALVP